MAEALGDRFPRLDGDPRIVRDVLAGDDDAEDAQWLSQFEPRTAVVNAVRVR